MINLEMLRALPLNEKISAMETLWDALCRDSSVDVLPSWHEGVLQQRKADIQEGKHRDWSEAKNAIRRSAEN